MWAAFKSDLKEFAAGAAEETNVVAERVVGTRILPAGGGGGFGDDDGAGAAGVAALPGAAALSSIGERGLRGLTSVSSMMGGIVAPRHPPARSAIPSSDDDDDAGGGGYDRGVADPPLPAAAATIEDASRDCGIGGGAELLLEEVVGSPRHR